MGSYNFNNSGTPGRIATQFCTDVVLAHRYRTIHIVRYRHLREPRKLSWNFSITDYQGRRLRFASGGDKFGERSEPKKIFAPGGDNPPQKQQY